MIWGSIRAMLHPVKVPNISSILIPRACLTKIPMVIVSGVKHRKQKKLTLLA